ncbi:hypothetical protein CCR85_07180 [Rhodothalassium salexigens]|uniref:TonB-dependent receptor plug domain-containing protein n=1 Tax=Rhodothalassium salexigens TaxID=1086 RepID=UPI0019118C8B|nr:TonB-dependent receptor plug domain-containing protein [Rhodothalassium salexigens]MBK5911274.1 hypothetical protein [Rhodothalassium salexigens]
MTVVSSFSLLVALAAAGAPQQAATARSGGAAAAEAEIGERADQARGEPAADDRSSEAAPATDGAAVDLGTVDVVDHLAPLPAYGNPDPLDSGAAVIGKDAIEAFDPGLGDANQLLRFLPNVRFDVGDRSADPENIQDLRPSEISISGGLIDSNNFRLDGVGVNNIFDVTENNPAAADSTAGARGQTIFLSPELIESLEVRDSNVSARYGDFSGGVVEAELRDPSGGWGASATVEYQNDSLVKYIRNEDAGEDAFDPTPNFNRWRVEGTLDIPVTEDFALLTAFSTNRSDVRYRYADFYFNGASRQNQSRSDQFLVKGAYDISPDLKLAATVIYSPYEQEFTRDNMADDMVVTKGGGLTSKLELDGVSGRTDWHVQTSFVRANMGRTAPTNSFSWDSTAPSIEFCTLSSCSTGGFGDIDQIQKDWSLLADMSRPAFGGTFTAGIETLYISAYKARPETSLSYSRGAFNPATVCADPNDPACIDGEIGLTRYNVNAAFEADVDVFRQSAWIEQRQEFGPVEVRAGLRYSYEDFLGNHNIAPRLSAAWSITDEVSLTTGLNRYYEGNFIGYAVRAANPSTEIYTRAGREENGQLMFSPDDWSLYRVLNTTDFRGAGLDTPYSDEVTGAVNFPLLGGLGRLKAVRRWYDDQIVSAPRDFEIITDPDGGTSFDMWQQATNQGETRFLGLSAEWAGSWRNHTLTMNANWTKTRNNSAELGSAFDTLDPEDFQTTPVFFEGELLTLAQLQDRFNRANYADPVTANVGLQSQWFGERLESALWLSYVGSQTIARDARRSTEVDGVRYRIYELAERDASVRVDLNLTYTLTLAGRHDVGIQARIGNLFNIRPQTSFGSFTGYQEGRTVWLGLRYDF